MAKSERAAWQKVLGYAQALDGNFPKGSEIQRIGADLSKVAKDMLFQLSRGVHENPPEPDVKLHKCFSERVYGIQYKHDDDGRDYQHPFKPGVQLWKATIDGQDAVVMVGKRGQQITGEF